LQTFRVLRTWGVGLLISSSENPQNANFAITEFSEVRGAYGKSRRRRQLQ
jgi:hypothetical protein